jgi:protein gp37
MWFGVSVENEQATSRIAHLQKTNASICFLSIEPLIAPVGKVSLAGIAWVIVGGESLWVHPCALLQDFWSEPGKGLF